MSEIINTGLGWWANEDWLQNSFTDLGSMGGAIIDTLKNFPLLPPSSTHPSLPTNAELTDLNYIGWYDPELEYDYYLAFKPRDSYGITDHKLITYNTGSSKYLLYLLKPSTITSIRGSLFTTTPAGGVADRGAYTLPLSSYGDWRYSTTAAPTFSSGLVPTDIYFSSATSATDVIDEVLDGTSTPFYKLNSGYSIACFARWINANQQELVAPILISTDQNAVVLSTDGTTPASGIVTGIEFGGMTFYINILLGYSGAVTANVPYQDLRSIFPTGANITELFRAIVTLAQVRFTDPYAQGGHSGPGGGGGTFDLESDVIGLPSLPTMSFAATGFTRIYNPTLSELNSLANYLWTDTTFLDTVINHLKQLLENPMDAIISLALLPCPIPNGSPEAVKVMYINTGVTMAPATSQFVDVDCGTYTLQEFYGSALDYNPYTKVHCYLPYIGQVTLDTDEVMGRTIHVRYRIDIVTGMCAALISVNQSGSLDETVMYQFSGHCSINMPINSADFSGYIGAAMTAGKMVAGVVAGASGNLPLAAELIGAPAPHSSTSETTEKTTERNPKTGRQVTAGTRTRTTIRNTPGASFGEMSRKAGANTVGAVMGSKLTVEHAGGFTGNSGYLAVRRPYLIIERPRMCNPEEYGRYNGRPSMIYMNLGDCEGYTEVQSIQFDGISATNPELAELSELLKSGVLF